MVKILSEPTKMKVFSKGQVVIPVALRKKYRIHVGDHIRVVPTSKGILLKSIPKQDNKESLTKRLFGVFGSYTQGKATPGKGEITKATEEGFTKGWAK